MKKKIKNLWKKFTKKSLFYKISIILLPLIFIGLVVTIILLAKRDYTVKPSKADIETGITSTFKNASKINCEYYGKVKYNKTKARKYTCTFEDKIENTEENKERSNCLDCQIDNNAWKCSISTSKCYK